ncbi:MAG: DUF5119 domain-containing protein [Muribaculaceae bacterium]|nr:DUF5119 domain-containing protein [Muribaculaceae bacterium]
MKLRALTMVAVSLLSAMLLSSCRHKDLYMEEAVTSQLYVKFDWSQAPDANPSSMALYMYENDGTNPMRFIFSNRDGGYIKVPFGTRHAICMNGDNTDWAHLRGKETIENMELYTSDAEMLESQKLSTSALPRSRESESERMAKTPGMLWAQRTNEIRIVPHEGTDTITLYPHEAVCHYIVDIYDVDNLEGVSSASIDAVISGMAEGYSLGQQTSTDAPVTMPFTLKTNVAGKSLHSEFLTFGECSNTSHPHHLTVYMILKDGSKWFHTFDVTQQVTQAPDPTHVHIIIKGLPLPEPPAEGGTQLSADVNEWQPVYIDMKM